MSPEQAQGSVIDQRSDLFSFGSVLYVMCSGRPPFRASTAVAVLKRVVEEEPRPIQDIIPDIPDWLVAIIARLHAEQPEERLSTALEVSQLLERGGTRPISSGAGADLSQTQSIETESVLRARPPSFRWRWWGVAAASALCVGILLSLPFPSPATRHIEDPEGASPPLPKVTLQVQGEDIRGTRQDQNANPDREAAQWARSIDGDVDLVAANGREFYKPRQLPDESFQL